MFHDFHNEPGLQGARHFFARIKSVRARVLRLFRELSAVKVPGTWDLRCVKLPGEDPVTGFVVFSKAIARL